MDLFGNFITPEIAEIEAQYDSTDVEQTPNATAYAFCVAFADPTSQ